MNLNDLVRFHFNYIRLLIKIKVYFTYTASSSKFQYLNLKFVEFLYHNYQTKIIEIETFKIYLSNLPKDEKNNRNFRGSGYNIFSI